MFHTVDQSLRSSAKTFNDERKTRMGIFGYFQTVTCSIEQIYDSKIEFRRSEKGAVTVNNLYSSDMFSL